MRAVTEAAQPRNGMAAFTNTVSEVEFQTHNDGHGRTYLEEMPKTSQHCTWQRQPPFILLRRK